MIAEPISDHRTASSAVAVLGVIDAEGVEVNAPTLGEEQTRLND